MDGWMDEKMDGSMDVSRIHYIYTPQHYINQFLILYISLFLYSEVMSTRCFYRHADDLAIRTKPGDR